ncbi:MAG TPA: TolC family protein [Variovorax sp.]|nr:TolC family protein [Variovorax sp.]
MALAQQLPSTAPQPFPARQGPSSAPLAPSTPTVSGAAVIPASVAAVLPAPLTLDEVLRAARENPDVSASRLALSAARADILAADHAPSPVLTAKAASIDLQNGIGTGGLARKRVDSSVGVDWTWERGGKRAARTAAAERAADAARFDIDDVQLDQQLVAGSAFYDLLGAQERIVEINAIERSASQLAGTATRRVQAGDLPAQEAARTEVEAQRSAVDLRAAELDRDRAQLVLARILGATAAVRGRLAGTDWPVLGMLPYGTAGEVDLDTLIENRADIRAARARVASASASLDNAQAQRTADVTIGASLERYPTTSNRLLEVRASIPLLFNYRAEGEIGRALAVYTQTQENLDRARNDARLELQRLRAEAESNARRLQVFQRDILGGAQKLADNAELAYRRGALSLTDLLDARRTLRATQLDAINARVDHAKATLAWRLRTQTSPTP